MNECIVPSQRFSEDNRWISQLIKNLKHTRHIQECKEAEPEVLLIGDSIIQKMIYCEELWSEISALHPLNFGIGGDRTQHVLWRILNGSIDQTNPRVIVLHVGTNNQGNTSQQISDGILKIVHELQRIFPSTYIIVWGLLPRGENPNKASDINKEVNEILKKNLEERPSVEIICTGNDLRQLNGQISCKDMYDYLHLTEQGYIKTFTPILKRMKQILNAHN